MVEHAERTDEAQAKDAGFRHGGGAEAQAFPATATEGTRSHPAGKGHRRAATDAIATRKQGVLGVVAEDDNGRSDIPPIDAHRERDQRGGRIIEDRRMSEDKIGLGQSARRHEPVGRGRDN